MEQQSKLMKNNNEKSTRQPSLIWAITRIFWAPYMLQGLLLLVQATVLHVCQPVLQKWIIGYFNPEENLTTRDQVLLYAGFLVLVTVGVVFVTHHTTLRTQQIGMRIRIACCSLLYRKVGEPGELSFFYRLDAPYSLHLLSYYSLIKDYL